MDSWCQRIDFLGSAKMYQTRGFSRFSSMIQKQSYVSRNKKCVCTYGAGECMLESEIGENGLEFRVDK